MSTDQEVVAMMNFINSIIRFSLKNRFTIIAGTLIVVLGGIWSARHTDIDVFPDLTAPTVVIMADANGMTAEEVERLVTFPLETAMNGATNVRRVRSASLSGYAFVWVEFDWGADVFKARQVVSEKMATVAESLPEGITPLLAPQSSVMGEILMVGMQSEGETSLMDLRTIAEWVVKPAVLATGGVSQVTVIGGDYKQYQILADPVRMKAYGVNLKDLEEVGRTFSDNSNGSVIRDWGNEYALRGIARTTDPDELGSTFVKSYAGRPVVLSDVADVVIGSAVRMGMASQNATPAVLLSISKQPDVNTLTVTEQIESSLADVAKTLPQDVHLDTHIFRQADFIEASVSNVAEALIEGAVFVIVILFLFLGSLRTTVISVVAIPLSLLGTMVVMKILDMDINTMTLGGMCIAIGSLVDDAIIDVENVYRCLRLNHRLPVDERRPVLEVVFAGSAEIRSSILNATFIIMVAFVPLFFLSGLEGRMLKPLGITYIISLFVSLVVAMTVTPLLCSLMLTSDTYLQRNEGESRLSGFLSRKYSESLHWVMSHSRTVLSVTGVLLAFALVLFFMMGRSFLPDFNEGSAVISAVAQPGVSLDLSDELGNMVEQELLQIPEVTSTARRTGRGELDEHSQSINGAEIEVQFNLQGRSRRELFDEMRVRMASVPGIVTSVGQPLGHRIDHMLSGTRAGIAIKLFGTDLATMYQLGNRIKDEISGIEGLVDISVEQQTETPQIQVRANRAALARYGISIADFNDFIRYGFGGEKIADIYEGQRSFDVVLRYAGQYTSDIAGLKDALIDTPDGGKVPLTDVAEIVSTGGPASISRENVQRKLVVSANVSGRDLGTCVDEIKDEIAEHIVLPEGYRIEYGGQFESQQSASRTLALALVAALAVIFMLLMAEFRSIPLSAIVMISLPLALIGGVFAVFVSSSVVSIPSIIGFITLFGVATRNGILLISRYSHLQSAGMPLREAVLNGSADRLNPILMTALTSALALIPLIVNGEKAGNEIQSPMAIVVLGGLVTSTLLNIYVMPIIYEWYAKKNHIG